MGRTGDAGASILSLTAVGRGIVGDMSESFVDLLWLPLGAGDRTRLVGLSGRTYERLVAARTHRRPRPLFHSALELAVEDARYVVEMAPRWRGSAVDRGVRLRGPVGLHALGHSRWFQYEVRCWRDGVIPDREQAVGGPTRISSNAAQAERLLDALPSCPRLVWGRDQQGTGEMWNSNSVVAWLLTVSGHEASRLVPPGGGRAPGWSAGLAVAHRW